MQQCSVVFSRPFWHSVVTVLLLSSPALILEAHGSSTGITGRTNGGGGCGSCHGLSPDTGIAVAVTGPATLVAGQTGTYTVTATKSGIANGLKMGVDIAASDGALAVVFGQAMSLASNELTHNASVGTLATTTGGTGSAGYTFSYTMPATAAGGSTHTLYSAAHLQTTSGSQTAGWNYGANFTVTTAVTAPGAPTNATATAGNGQAVVTFNAASENGSAITKYTVTANPAAGTDVDANSAALTHTIIGLTNGITYNFTVTATNGIGTGPPSNPSNSVVPNAVAPAAIALNPLTNRIYMANYAGNNLVVRNGANEQDTTIAVGTGPAAVAVNPASNKVYVANYLSGNVTVIDGATHATTSIAAGANPIALAINPVTGKIYVANYNSATVMVIDEATGSTASIAVGNGPSAIAVNPVTNKIYVANYASGSVTAIDGATGATTTIGSGAGVTALAVNVVTNRIYAANYFADTLAVISGADHSVTSIPLPAGSRPVTVALNPLTNTVYAANFGNATVSVIDGVTNAVTSVATGDGPRSIGVNTTTNRIHVANQLSYSLTTIDGASNATITRTLSTGPGAVAINPLTARVYIANFLSPVMNVIDDATFEKTIIAVGSAPKGIAVNPATNKIYVANSLDGAGGNSVTVIDGATGSTTSIGVGPAPEKIVINPVTNRVYVLNSGDATVSVIDGANSLVATIAPPGPTPPPSSNAGPNGIAVNPVTNKIYATRSANNEILVIDGSTNAFSSVAVGISPRDVDVNPVTNRVYVSNFGSGSVTCDASVSVIDGNAGAVIATPAATCGNSAVNSILVNPRANKIYVMSFSGVNLIDGVTHSSVPTGVGAGTTGHMAVNQVSNLVYVPHWGSYGVKVINSGNDAVSSISTGTTGSTTFTSNIAANPVTNKSYFVIDAGGPLYTRTIDGVTSQVRTAVNTGADPRAFAVNPATSRIYVSDFANNNVHEISEQKIQSIPLTVTITPLPGNVSNSDTPTFTFTTGGTLMARRVHYQLDTWQGAWSAAAGGPPSFAATLPSLQPGTHTLFAFATDGQEASSVTSGQQSSPLIGQVAAYTFTYVPAPANLVAVVSRKAHGSFGPCDLMLDRNKTINQAVTVEPRSASGSHTLVFKFDSAVVSAGTATATSGTGSPIAINPVTGQNNEVSVALPSVADMTRATVTLSNVNDAGGNFPVSLGFLVGDVTNTRATSAADLSAIKSRYTPALNAANCLFDLNLSGAIDAADLTIAKSRSGTRLP